MPGGHFLLEFGGIQGHADAAGDIHAGGVQIRPQQRRTQRLAVAALPVSAPFHSSLMKPAAEKLREALAKTELAAPQIPVLNNVDVAVETDADKIRDALYRQAFGPVRWVECVQALKARGVTHIVECGPGKVLAGMTKRIDSELVGASIYDPATLAETKELLA